VVIYLESPKIAPVEVKVCEDAVTPCLYFKVHVEGVRSGSEIYIPIDGRLYSDDEKLLSQVIFDDVFFNPMGASRSPAIIVGYPKERAEFTPQIHALDLECRAFLDAKSLNYIEERRRANNYHRVELKLKLRFLVLHSMVFQLPSLPSDAIMLKSGTSLLYVMPKVYEELKTDIIIDDSRWIKEFLPLLGLGSYVLLEIPLPKPQSIPDEAFQHFTNVINSLKRAREVLYENLDVGPSLTALRNALSEFCMALKPSGLTASTESGGCEIIEEKFRDLFQDHKELLEIVEVLFKKVRSIATAGPEPTQPHVAPRPALTPRQVESLIGLASYMIKLVMDTYTHQQATMN